MKNHTMKKIILTTIILLGVFQKALFAQNIGINTADPYTTLDVKGNIFTSVHASNNLNDVSEQVTRYIGHQSGNDIGTAFTGMKIQVGPFGKVNQIGSPKNGTRISFQTWGNNISPSRDLMLINEFGNVGIGTITPTQKLDVVGNAKFSGNGLFGNLRLGNDLEGIFQDSQNGGYRSLVTGGNQGFYFQNFSGQFTRMYIGISGTYAGMVGIGTITPSENLDVVGNAKFSGNGLFGGDGTYAGKVGIGTTEPTEKLEVIGNAKFSGNGLFGGGGTYAGRVGIGTTTPDAPLHITGGGISNASAYRTFFGFNTNNIITNIDITPNIKVHVVGTLWVDSGIFVATSDKRIKNIIGQTNTANDLAILNKIQITDYKYKDEISNGSGLQKKVIAQQLQEVYPIAVNTNKGIIPNVFDRAKTVMVNGGSTMVSTNKPHDFKTGDKVKLILEKTGEKIVEITVINDTQFTVNETINDNIFVYGKHVNDLLNVDYDAVAMLNVSATQELAKQVQFLLKKIAELETKINANENSNANTALTKK